MLCLIDTKGFDKAFFEKIKEAENKIFLSSKKEKSNNISICGRVLLGFMLQREYGINSFSYRYGENEKPYLENENIFFNISHSGTAIICTLDSKETGCDIQQIREYNPKVAKRFFTEKEFSLIETSSDKEKNFTRLWALKESILKKKGTGIGGGLATYDFSSHIHADTFSAYGCNFRCFPYGNYEIALCSENDDNDLEIIEKNEIESYMDNIKI